MKKTEQQETFHETRDGLLFERIVKKVVRYCVFLSYVLCCNLSEIKTEIGTTALYGCRIRELDTMGLTLLAIAEPSIFCAK